jgi:hypothetical protein
MALFTTSLLLSFIFMACNFVAPHIDFFLQLLLLSVISQVICLLEQRQQHICRFASILFRSFLLLHLNIQRLDKIRHSALRPFLIVLSPQTRKLQNSFSS